MAAPISTDPRVIADEVWAKLLWAGLNLQAPDLPGTSAGSYHPLELIRALAVTWLFSRLRSDEISRLRVGCVRWRHEGQPIEGASREVLAEQAVCLLDVPVNKTSTAFTKPVDPIVGQAIEAWQALRSTQPERLDVKTNERVDLLFSIRAHPVAKNYINRTLIPSLCEKAGVLISIPLTGDEGAAVGDGQTALDALLGRLAEAPTRAGPSPRDLNRPTTSALLPIVEVDKALNSETAGHRFHRIVGYLSSGSDLIVTSGNPKNVSDFASLCGLKLGVQAGTTERREGSLGQGLCRQTDRHPDLPDQRRGEPRAELQAR
ncbi:hypothetical protein ACFZDK_55610 [Streptomyces sp. NPDC007901]|uniref:hypothetical protein n=1 Tax=Streptomyces sp. NPDC007901 TaxID=3364785 RepID=UPI0036EA1716